MPKKSRKLVWTKTKHFTGWACQGCGWARPVPRMIDKTKTPSQDAKDAFASHKCAEHPLKPKKLTRREDVNQAAARIVREATE